MRASSHDAYLLTFDGELSINHNQEHFKEGNVIAPLNWEV